MKRVGLIMALIAFACVMSVPQAWAQRSKEKSTEPSYEVLKTSGRKDVKPKMSGANQRLLGKAIDALNDDQDYPAVLELLDKILAGKPNSFEKSKALQVKATALYEQDGDDLGPAIAAVQEAVATDGLPNKDHLDALLLKAQLLNMAEKYEESTKAFDAYFADAPVIPASNYAAQSQNYYELEQFDKAIEWAEKALTTSEDPSNSWYQLKVNSLYNSERYDEAIAYLKELLAKDPTSKQFNNLLVSAYLQADQLDGALEQLTKMKDAKLFDSEAQWVQLYQVLLNLDRPADSAKVIEEGLASGGIKPSCDRLVDLGENYFLIADSFDDKDEAGMKAAKQVALSAFGKASELCTNGMSDMWRCQLMLDLDDAKGAEQACAASLSRGGLKQAGDVHYLLGIALYEQGKMKEAKAALTQAMTYPESKRNAEQMLKNLQ